MSNQPANLILTPAEMETLYDALTFSLDILIGFYPYGQPLFEDLMVEMARQQGKTYRRRTAGNYIREMLRSNHVELVEYVSARLTTIVQIAEQSKESVGQDTNTTLTFDDRLRADILDALACTGSFCERHWPDQAARFRLLADKFVAA